MKNKHLNYDDRLEIERDIEKGESFKEIGRKLGKDSTTISKEIKNHLIIKEKNDLGKPYLDCKLMGHCPYRAKGENCYIKNCEHYEQRNCEKLNKPPYVCNGCSKRIRCHMVKKYYDALKAQKEYESNLIESRQGVTYTQEELDYIDSILDPLIKDNGQSIHIAIVNNKNKIMISEREIYNLIENGYLKVKSIDLPREVRFRVKPKAKRKYKIDKKCRNGRTWDDYKKYMSEHPETNVVEMDTVIGSVGGKCLLTLHFRNCSFMLAILREHDDAQSVIDIFNNIEDIFGIEKFKELFPIILTDNGPEFSNPEAIEFDPKTGEKRTQIFYCNPNRPDQKGSCEVNHEFIRRILPSGTSFDNLTQDKINLMMSHIDSYRRGKLNEKSPYETFSFLYGEKIANQFGIEKINDNDICLKPDLLK